MVHWRTRDTVDGRTIIHLLRKDEYEVLRWPVKEAMSAAGGRVIDIQKFLENRRLYRVLHMKLQDIETTLVQFSLVVVQPFLLCPFLPGWSEHVFLGLLHWKLQLVCNLQELIVKRAPQVLYMTWNTKQNQIVKEEGGH